MEMPGKHVLALQDPFGILPVQDILAKMELRFEDATGESLTGCELLRVLLLRTAWFSLLWD